MATDKNLVIKGIKFLAYTVGIMFLAPFVLYQAFKNTEHAFFIPVLILGILFAILAIGLGFYSIKILMDGFFSKKN
ncbi:DUF6095 family protein [Eudoraea chungangensis]|uniref:DUF6095 family protein n=1 Tax=Eudoraea chungangensis TaxID=1481905 RepID=UPI0023EDA922|nr:DUF6095 family protein [Eudoraea chungangensis]